MGVLEVKEADLLLRWAAAEAARCPESLPSAELHKADTASKDRSEDRGKTSAPAAVDKSTEGSAESADGSEMPGRAEVGNSSRCCCLPCSIQQAAVVVAAAVASGFGGDCCPCLQPRSANRCVRDEGDPACSKCGGAPR